MKDTEKAAEKIANANTLGQVEAILTEYAQHHTKQVLDELIEWGNKERAFITSEDGIADRYWAVGVKAACDKAKQLRDES